MDKDGVKISAMSEYEREESFMALVDDGRN